MKIVDDSSGIMNSSNEMIIPMAECNHHQICRFERSSSKGYLAVVSPIKKLAGGKPSNIAVKLMQTCSVFAINSNG